MSYLYRGAMRVRNHLYDRGVIKCYIPQVPVLGIGNLAAGGSGKTPLVIYLAKLFLKKGVVPAVLCKSYAGSIKAPLLVHKDTPAKVAGDEAILLQTALPKCDVVTAPNKTEGIHYIEQTLQPNLIIVDDFFQHRTVKAKCSIVLLDITTEQSRRELLENRVLPIGRLREPLSSLRRADIVILSNRSLASAVSFSEIESFKEKLFSKVGKVPPIFYSYINKAKVISGKTNREVSTPLSEASVFCGIASPTPFLKTVRKLGINIKEKFIFSDHHFFKEREIKKLLQHKPLLCTEKDFVRLPKEIKKEVYYLQINIKITEEENFFLTLKEHLQQSTITFLQ